MDVGKEDERVKWSLRGNAVSGWKKDNTLKPKWKGMMIHTQVGNESILEFERFGFKNKQEFHGNLTVVTGSKCCTFKAHI